MGVWIEMLLLAVELTGDIVTPFVGVWIEIQPEVTAVAPETGSLPSWECGLKCHICNRAYYCVPSLPSWECGLKSRMDAKKLG